MPKASVVATTTHELQIKPTVKRKLMTALKTYAVLAAQKKALKLAMQKESRIVEAIQVELGESSIDIEGFKATIVAPIKNKFDKQRFVTLGGDLDIFEKAHIATPGKSYVKITAPGAKDGDDDE